MMTGEPDVKNRTFLARHKDTITTIAALFGLVAFGWNVVASVKAWWIGPSVSLLPIEGRVIEFRCASSRIERCFEQNGARMTLVAPVFLYNSGSAGYDELVDVVEVTLSGPVFLDLRAHTLWFVTENDRGERPFVPFYVSGQSFVGQELRFVQFGDRERMSWVEFLTEFANASEGIELTVKARLFDAQTWVEQSCIAHAPSSMDRQIQFNEDGLPVGGAWEISLFCLQS